MKKMVLGMLVGVMAIGSSAVSFADSEKLVEITPVSKMTAVEINGENDVIEIDGELLKEGAQTIKLKDGSTVEICIEGDIEACDIKPFEIMFNEDGTVKIDGEILEGEVEMIELEGGKLMEIIEATKIEKQ